MNKPSMILLLLSLLLTAPPVRANPDDRDIEIYSSVARAGAEGGRFLDLAYAEDGTLVAAYAEVHYSPDRLVIQTSIDGGSTWQLHSSSHYYLDTISGVAVDVASGYPGSGVDDRIFVAVSFDENPSGQLANPYAQYIALVSGPLHRPWGGAGFISFVNMPCQPAAQGFPPQPDVAVVSLGPKRPGDYAVAVAFAYSEIWDPSLPSLEQGGSIFAAYSLDHGRSLAKPRKIAGPDAKENRGPFFEMLQGNAYAHPSLAHEERYSGIALAFEDRTRDVVHVMKGSAFHHIVEEGPIHRIYTTDQDDGRPEHHPKITAADGSVSFTCLAGEQGPGEFYELLHFFDMPVHLTRQVVELPVIHPRARSAGDIRIREGTAYVTALCDVDPQMGKESPTAVLAFEGSRTDLVNSMRVFPVSDVPSPRSTPSVAISPPGAPFTSQVYGFADFESRTFISGGFLYVDPSR